jgi:predicted nucleic acid-binding protein
VIVLDASVLIAHLWSSDPHHELATRVLDASAGDDLVVHELNLAEVLVGGVRAGRGEQMLLDLELIGVTIAERTEEDALLLATLRVRTGLKLPDCCVLATAVRHRASVLTFDASLATAGHRLGLKVRP